MYVRVCVCVAVKQARLDLELLKRIFAFFHTKLGLPLTTAPALHHVAKETAANQK